MIRSFVDELMKLAAMGQAKRMGKTPADVPQGQLRMGTKEEKREHGITRAEAARFSADHLVRDPKYYTHLEEMERKHEE